MAFLLIKILLNGTCSKSAESYSDTVSKLKIKLQIDTKGEEQRFMSVTLEGANLKK